MALQLSNVTTWKDAFQEFYLRFKPFLGRKEVRIEARDYLQGLLAPIARKNCWNLAEMQDKKDPQPTQRLLRIARIKRENAQDEYKLIVRENIASDDGIFVVDETGVRKSGDDSVGVQRQYCGALGKVDNCQIGVMLSYTSSKGRAFLDRRLYLSQKWADDVDRRKKAHVPEEIEFKTKPELGVEMLKEVFEQQFPGKWVVADTVYGQSPPFRNFLLEQRKQFVLAVPCTTEIWSNAPKMRTLAKKRKKPNWVVDKKRSPKRTVAQVAYSFRPHKWKRLQIKEGSKGWREYDWAAKRVTLSQGGTPCGRFWLLVRRSVSNPEEMAYYLCHAPAQVELKTLAFVAASRWTIETCIKEVKGEMGFDEYQVRCWEGWHRHTLFAMMAHLFVALLKKDHPPAQNSEMGVLSVPEIRRLLELIFPLPQRSKSSKWRWSVWRRKHNEKARRSHYKKRGHSLAISGSL